jgi:hypothetical protein
MDSKLDACLVLKSVLLMGDMLAASKVIMTEKYLVQLMAIMTAELTVDL